jgi:hypothetical protein
MRPDLRRFASFAILASVVAAWCSLPAAAHAQGHGGQQQGSEDEDAKNRKRDEEWGNNQRNLSLPQLRNAGPCPYVKVLYDAARYVEMKEGRPSASRAGFTGEIQGLSSACEYKNEQPIHVQARLLFEFGRGPQAGASAHTYRYWVAVTDRNRAVLDKQYFDVPVSFPAGHDRVTKTEDVLGIVIPRADIKVSGANFEVLVGFDVTPEMAAFNRQGQRFRVNAGETTASR